MEEICLVPNVPELHQPLELGLRLSQSGLLVAEADIHIGVPELGHAVTQHAVADVGVELVGVPDHPPGVEGDQVHPLPGIPWGVDVGDVVPRHVEGGLGGVNPQPCGGEGTKGTNNSHSCSPLS